MTAIKDSKPACPQPCSSCPWLTANHGKPHPGHWYTAKNRRRLWAGLRLGESMSCHKTDPDNPVPAGAQPVSPGTTTHECTGGLILQQREFMRFSKFCDEASAEGKRDGFKRYWAAGGLMPLHALKVLLHRAILGGSPLGGLEMARPDLDAPVSL